MVTKATALPLALAIVLAAETVLAGAFLIETTARAIRGEAR